MTGEEEEKVAKIQELSELIDEFKICMLTSVGSDGRLFSRPMVAVGLDMDGSLWFFTSVKGQVKQQVEANPKVNVSFSDIKGSRYLSLTGEAGFVHDRGKAYDLWRPDFRTWFPAGEEDPDLVLMRVRLDQAEFWDSPSRVGVTLSGMVMAVVTGKRQYTTDHEQVNFSQG